MPANNKSTPCYCINMRRVSHHTTEHYNRALEPCGLTVSQLSVLWHLDFLGQSNTTALAERVGLDRSTLVRNLKPMQRNGYIDDISTAGHRDRILRVTNKGKMALEIGIPLWKAAQKDVLRLLGPEKLADLKNILSQLQEL